MEYEIHYVSAQALTQDVAFLIESLNGSKVVEISEDKCFIRAAVTPTSWPLENQQATLTKSVFNPEVPEFVPSKPTTTGMDN